MRRLDYRHRRKLDDLSRLSLQDIIVKVIGQGNRKNRQLLRLLERPTQTNCYWVHYDVAQVLKPLVRKNIRSKP